MADTKTFTSPIEETTARVDTASQSGQGDLATLAPLIIPDPNMVAVVNVQAGEELPIAFSLDDARIEIVEADLHLNFANGSTIVLKGFAELSSMENPPSIVMEDGTVLPADAVLFPYLDADSAPAAGPTVTSGGVGIYRSDLGQVIEGVDRLGTQDPSSLTSSDGTELDDKSLLLDGQGPPDAVDDMASTDEGGSVVIPVLPNDNDPDGDPLEIVSFTQPTLGSVTQNSDNTFTFNTDGNFEELNTGETATETFTYTITDGQGGTDTATVIITINGTNDSPIAVADNNIIVEQADSIADPNAVVGNVLDGSSSGGTDSVDDSDPSGDSLFADFFVASVDGTAVGDGATSIVIGGDYGALTINGDGSYSYELDDANSEVQALNTDSTALEDVFSYTMNDGDGGTDIANLTITINGTNDSPIAVADNNIIVEQADSIADPNAVTGNVLDGSSSGGTDSVDDSDPSGDSLFADFFVASVDGTAVGDGATSIVIGGDYGALTINGDGSYSYELDDANSEVQALNTDSTALEDVFSYTMNDGDGGTDIANLTITINGTNDSPIAVADNNIIVEQADSIADPNAVTGNVLDGSSSGGTDSVDDSDPSGDSLFADFFVASVDGTAVGDGATSIVIGGDYGALTINGDGSYSYELDDANSEVQALNTDSTALEDVFSYTMNDGDGGTDIANLIITINGADDLATLVATNTTVSEEGLEFGNLDLLPSDYDLLPGDDVLNNPNDNTNLVVNSGTFTLTDIDTVYTVDDISLATAAALLTADGVAVNFAWNAIADALIGTRGDNGDEVIRVSVDSVTPSFDNYVVAYTVTLSAPIEHPFTGDGSALIYDESIVAEQDEDEISFNIDVTAGITTFTDAFVVTVEDDSPINIVPEDAVLSNLALESFTANLDFDAQVEDNIGADQPANVRFPVSLESLADTGLTSGGLEVSYDVSADGQTLTGYTVAGNIFTIALNVDAAGIDQYTVTMIGTVDGGASVIDFNAGGYDFVGGNGGWAGFNTEADDDSQDLLLTPIGADTVNTNANEGGVGGGNSVGPTEAIRADFVIDLDGDPKGTPYTDISNQDHTFDSHYQVNGSSVLFTHTMGSSVIVKTFDDADGNDVGDGVQDAITAVGISYGGEEGFVSFAVVGTTTETVTLNGYDFYVTFDGTEVQIDGVISDSMISTFTVDGYNSVEYWHAGGETFKIGDFGTTVIDLGEPVEFSVALEVVDADGDLADGTIDVLLTPPDVFDVADSSQMLTLEDSIIYAFSANGGEGDLVIDGFNVDTDVIRLTDVLDLDSDGALDLDDVTVGVVAQGSDLVLTITGQGGVDTSVTLADVGEYQGVDSLDSLAQAGFQVEYTG